MKPITLGIAVTAAAMASNLVYASARELPVKSSFPSEREKESQMVIRPKNQMELAKNLKYILDHDLELKDDFYSKSSLKNVFNLDEVVINKTNDNDGSPQIFVMSRKFSAVFPEPINSENTKFSPGAQILIRRTTHTTGEVSAGINFGMDVGGPTFDEAWKIFGNEFSKLDPLFPGPHGRPLPARAIHGNESWRRKLVIKNTEKTVTLSFNRDSELSHVLIETKNKIQKGTNDNGSE